MEWIHVSHPTFYPGTCIDGSQDECFDTQVELPGNVRVYVSVRDVRENASKIGLVPFEQYMQADQRALDAENRVVVLETELAEARPVLDAMHAAATKYGSVDDDPPVPQEQQPRREAASARKLRRR